MKKISKTTLGLFILLVSILSIVAVMVTSKKINAGNDPQTVSVENKGVTQTITASGDIETQNQDTLAFLSSGRVTYLGVKEGDSVLKGQVLANLDTTIASHTETASEAQYRSAQAALNKVIDDIHLFQYGNGGESNIGSSNETQTQKTQRQQAEEAVNAAFDNMQSAKKQLDLLSIVAPFDGKILSIQNISEGINVSPTTASNIIVSGGGDLKFVANILDQDINKLHSGQKVEIRVDSNKDKTLTGTISRIADGKTTLPDGSNIFKVEIQSIDLQNNSQAGQTGSVEIAVDNTDNSSVPSWTILADKYIWVTINGKPVLKEVVTGETRGNQTEIKSGLSSGDQVILDPQIIAKGKYQLL